MIYITLYLMNIIMLCFIPSKKTSKKYSKWMGEWPYNLILLVGELLLLFNNSNTGDKRITIVTFIVTIILYIYEYKRMKRCG